MRVTDQAGREGYAYGYTRGLPLLEMVRSLAPALIGSDPGARSGTVEAVVNASPSTRAIMSRAASLLEIALWDLLCAQLRMPLGDLLGATRTTVPVLAVAGYFRDVRGDDEVLEEIVRLEAEGITRIKLMVGRLETHGALEFIERACNSLRGGARLVVDAHYSLPSAEAAHRIALRLGDIGVWLFEDPFTPTEWRKLSSARVPGGAGIAVGEDVADPAQFLDLLGDATVLRVDPTTCGGIRAAGIGIAAAAVRGIPTIPHVFSRLSAQLARAYSTIDSVEHIPASTGADPIEDFLRQPFEIIDGYVSIDAQMGAGTALDWDGLAPHRSAYVSVDTK